MIVMCPQRRWRAAEVLSEHPYFTETDNTSDTVVHSDMEDDAHGNAARDSDEDSELEDEDDDREPYEEGLTGT